MTPKQSASGHMDWLLEYLFGYWKVLELLYLIWSLIVSGFHSCISESLTDFTFHLGVIIKGGENKNANKNLLKAQNHNFSKAPQNEALNLETWQDRLYI